jgi:hypothetical protein
MGRWSTALTVAAPGDSPVGPFYRLADLSGMSLRTGGSGVPAAPGSPGPAALNAAHRAGQPGNVLVRQRHFVT